MKKTFSLFAIALLVCTTGCSQSREDSIPLTEATVTISVTTAPVEEEIVETTVTTEETTAETEGTTTEATSDAVYFSEISENVYVEVETTVPTETETTVVTTETTVVTTEPPIVTTSQSTEYPVTEISETTPYTTSVVAEETVVSDTLLSSEATSTTEALPQKVLLDVKNIQQQPELPAGCEITSATIALNYYGFKCDKMEMLGHLPMMKEKDSNGRWITPWEGFVGDPETSRYGCYSPVIKTAIESYWEDQQVKGYEIVDLSGSELEELYSEVAKGNPVIIWAGIYMSPINTNLRSWVVQDGSTFKWTSNEHCLVLIGYDLEKGTVTLSDPWDSAGTVTYASKTVQVPYDQLEKQALVIHKTA